MNVLRIVTISVILLLLQGCVSAALSGASALYDRENIQSSLANQNINFDTSTRLASFKRHNRDARLNVATFNQTILLAGQVPNEQKRQEVINLVQGIPHVKYIYNGLTVAPTIPFSQQSYDSWLTTKIISKIWADFSINPRTIKVVTEDGVVYLMGNVPKEEAQAIKDIARHTEGVKHVVLLMRYLQYV